MQLKGKNEGVVYPVHLKDKNLANLTDDEPTWLDFTSKMDDEGEIIEESELANTLYETLNYDIAGKYDDVDVNKVMEDLGDLIYDKVRASDLEQALRNSEGIMYATNETGELASGDVISDIFAGLGFDGVVMDADKAFGAQKKIGKPMVMDYGTKHAIVFDPKNIRSKHAKFDPSKKESANILAGIGATGLGLSVLADKEDKHD